MADVFVDVDGYDNKIVDREYFTITGEDCYQTAAKYHTNFILGGMVVRGR